MELYEAQNFIKDEASQLRRLGSTAPAPDLGEALMAILLVLEDLMDTVDKLDEEYNK